MDPDFDEFREQLEEIIGYEGEVYTLGDDEEDDGDPPLRLVVYDDVPDEGSITAFTWGVSQVEAPGHGESPDGDDDADDDVDDDAYADNDDADDDDDAADADDDDADDGQPLGRELMISVESTDVDWAFALGVLAKSLRGRCPFEKGNVLKFGERVVKSSGLTAFVVYHPPTVLEEAQARIDLEDITIQLMQLVPIYEEEIPVLEKLGVDAFFADDDFDIYKVDRPPRRG